MYSKHVNIDCILAHKMPFSQSVTVFFFLDIWTLRVRLFTDFLWMCRKKGDRDIIMFTCPFPLYYFRFIFLQSKFDSHQSVITIEFLTWIYFGVCAYFFFHLPKIAYYAIKWIEDEISDHYNGLATVALKRETINVFMKKKT